MQKEKKKEVKVAKPVTLADLTTAEQTLAIYIKYN